MADGKLETDRHIKPTNQQLYLHHSSNQPPQVFKATRQAVTLKTICSQEEIVLQFYPQIKMYPNI